MFTKDARFELLFSFITTTATVQTVVTTAEFESFMLIKVIGSTESAIVEEAVRFITPMEQQEPKVIAILVNCSKTLILVMLSTEPVAMFTDFMESTIVEESFGISIDFVQIIDFHFVSSSIVVGTVLLLINAQYFVKGQSSRLLHCLI